MPGQINNNRLHAAALVFLSTCAVSLIASFATAGAKEGDPASRESPGLCEKVLAAARACAFQSRCTEDTPIYLSAANRDALIAMERRKGYSMTAFERYCSRACMSGSSEIHAQAFEREVCGDGRGATTIPKAQPNFRN